MLGVINYSTEQEKDMESRSVKYAYQLRDNSVKFIKYQAASLLGVLTLSLFTLRDSFTCTGSFDECDTIRSKLSCKAQLVSPISLQFNVSVSHSKGAYVSVMCGWETATSQIRVCIVLCALYATYLAYEASTKENRKMTDTYLSSVHFLAFLLATTSFFDILSIVDSQGDNYSTCHMEHGSKLKEWTSTSQNTIPPCSFFWFWLLPVLCFASAGIVYKSHTIMTQFRKSIAIDGL